MFTLTQGAQMDKSVEAARPEELQIVRRHEWKAEPVNTDSERRLMIAQHVIFMDVPRVRACITNRHCSYSVHLAQKLDLSRHKDIKHNFLVGADDMVYEGRGWGFMPVLPTRAEHLKENCICIGFIGKLFEGPPKHMERLAMALVRLGVDLGYIAADYKLHSLYSGLHRGIGNRALGYSSDPMEFID